VSGKRKGEKIMGESSGAGIGREDHGFRSFLKLRLATCRDWCEKQPIPHKALSATIEHNRDVNCLIYLVCNPADQYQQMVLHEQAFP
jgi:hypothetical protein